jgi:hypothetical protein
MKKLLSIFKFMPFVKRLLQRKYYATGMGTYLLNSIVKVLFRVNGSAPYLPHFTSRVNSPKKLLFLGSNPESAYLSMATSGGCYYQAINGIEIQEGTIWSYNCSFISANHSFEDLKKHEKVAPIRIGRDVWLGSNAIVLPGVEIGSYSIIGAGSVVSKSIPPYSIAVGNPARVVAQRCANCLTKLKPSEVHECTSA